MLLELAVLAVHRDELFIGMSTVGKPGALGTSLHGSGEATPSSFWIPSVLFGLWYNTGC